jgi:hypothetical protein
MSDHLEDFMKNNRDQFDQSNPGNELWDKINQGLNQAAAGAGAGAGAAGGSGGTTAASAGKILAGWKAVALVATLAVTGVGIYLGVTGKLGGNASGNESGSTTGDQLAQGNKVELLEEAQPVPFIRPALSGVDVPFGKHTVPAQQGGTITLENGTVIRIPENAFVHSDGSPVQGEVKIAYREFHDAADIILSGIPMKFNNDGKIEDFQTAGMVEITGSQGEKPVFIAQGKSIQIDMASFVEEDNYNLYYLDQNEKRWEDIGKAELKPNVSKREAKKAMSQIPPKPVKATTNESVFEFSVNYNQFPELKAFKNIIWEADNKKYLADNEWIFNEKWTKIDMKAKDREKGIYTIAVKNKKKSFKIDVVPALEGQDYDKAMADFKAKTEQYEKLVVQRGQEVERLNAQADVLRSFSINNFGIYNCDRFARVPNPISLDFNLDFGDDQAMRASQVMLFHIIGNERSVLPYYSAEELDRIVYSYEEDNYLVAILPGKKLGILYPQDFRPKSRGEMVKAGVLDAKLNIVDKQINNAGDLRKVLHM